MIFAMSGNELEAEYLARIQAVETLDNFKVDGLDEDLPQENSIL